MTLKAAELSVVLKHNFKKWAKRDRHPFQPEQGTCSSHSGYVDLKPNDGAQPQQQRQLEQQQQQQHASTVWTACVSQIAVLRQRTTRDVSLIMLILENVSGALQP